ncbi:hypothetical protein [Cohnella soli]|uniref:Uncharacterized protein n=1 Tax=Cohnella soli TaxID=425005 RepID=A0ABW0HUP3_9BACL
MMNGKVIRTDADLTNCIYFDTRVEVWMNGGFEEEVIIADYDDITIKIVGGGKFLRQNVILKVA